MNFRDLGLSPELQDVITGLGYIQPTPIQQQAIPQVLCGRDVFGCAQTGTGKTASFLLPLIDILKQGSTKSRLPRVVILEPTRELAAQVFNNFEQLSAGTGLTGALLVGGELMSDQEKQLKRGVDILVVTPGRLLDLFERGRVLLAGAKVLVIDEADRMLDMGFIPDIERIVALLPSQRQTLFFSATLPDEIKQLAKKYLMDAREIIITPSVKTAATVEQYSLILTEKQKLGACKSILEVEAPSSAIIFCNRKTLVNTLASALRKEGYKAQGLHGDMLQKKRNETLADFKEGKFPILVASDVAARGLDVESLAMVINYDVPTNAEEYVHRIGRTGRAGKAGKAIIFATAEETKSLRAIEKLIEQKIADYPTGVEGLPLARKIAHKPKEEHPVKKPTAKKEHSVQTSVVKENTVETPAAKENPERVQTPAATETSVKAKTHQSNDKNIKTTEKPSPEKSSPEKLTAVTGFGDFVPAFMRY
jgi:superfamily II DNA/RNA helicase